VCQIMCKVTSKNSRIHTPNTAVRSTHTRESVMEPFRVFLSHSTKEGDFVKKFAEELKHEGIDPWLCEWTSSRGTTSSPRLKRD